ncbi:MAG: sigma-70 family RNA polymerase sigma factor [Acidimicrobiia bacterium]|nr:sigma-70 family RNA polymerase sigma factor [Acidimicrobiia bacterium]NNL96989.1 sigma-70 family RNA polymerase sigma factor [Acidimicrobiia bacterium]
MTPESTTDVERRHEFEDLYSTYAGRVLGYALRRAPRVEAEEIVGDVFLTAWRRLDDIPGDPLPWLLATARNVLRNQRRAAHRQGALTARVGLDPQPRTADDPADRLIEVEWAQAALDLLTDSQREAVLLLMWDGLTRQQAAAALGCSRAALAVRVHRARLALGATLDPPPPRGAATARKPDLMEDPT